ncbi:PucR family transcriptional regulator [Nocardia sp. R16R-3T]
MPQITDRTKCDGQRITLLLGNPHLLEASQAHLRHGSDRKAAAARLHVHPNTFSYRLRRIAELTGIDPADPNNSRLLAASLTIQRIHQSPSRRLERRSGRPFRRLAPGGLSSPHAGPPTHWPRMARTWPRARGRNRCGDPGSD